MSLGFLRQRNHLIALNTGKTVQKIVNGIPGLQMIKEALHRHACTGENKFPAENVRVLSGDLAHKASVHTVCARNKREKFTAPSA